MLFIIILEKYCKDGDVRVENRKESGTGYIEFCEDEVWGRVCREGLDINDARVLCRQLNYPLDSKSACNQEIY